MEKTKKVSFDFDETLSKPSIQEYAKQLIQNGVDVCVITSRFSDEKLKLQWEKENNIEIGYDWNDNVDLFEIVDSIGLPRDKVIFTEFKWKYNVIKDIPELLWHLDDSRSEVKRLNENTKTIGIVCFDSWKNKCERILNK